MTNRYTFAVHGSAAGRRIKRSLSPGVGTQISTLPAIAARLAGGFLRPVDIDSLRIAVRSALAETDLGELEPIKDLPGMVDAAADTLRKLWSADLDLGTASSQLQILDIETFGLNASRTPEVSTTAVPHPRAQAIVALEKAVTERLPKGMLRSGDLVDRAIARIEHAPAVIGALEFVGHHDIAPCWRRLVVALSEVIPVAWDVFSITPHENEEIKQRFPHLVDARAPAWLPANVESNRYPPELPSLTAVSCANAQHEALEALRWARDLIASGAAKPEDIAIASPSTSDYDADLLALRLSGDVPFHFSHGIPVTATPTGQAAAALADILVRGISQTRLRRLVHATHGGDTALQRIPGEWLDLLPHDAPLNDLAAWRRAFVKIDASSWPDDDDRSAVVLDIVSLLCEGTDAAERAGDLLLDGAARELWNKALLAGHPSAIDRTIEGLRHKDSTNPYAAVQWMSADELSACPHKHVRLLGLTSSGWPRRRVDDRLLPDHVVPTHALEPLTVAESDRADFQRILASTSRSVVLSRPRREPGGRALARSPLLRNLPIGREEHLSRQRIPSHAATESDRMLARPDDFAATALAASTQSCWRDWHSDEITPHDGLIRPDHPAIASILSRTQSASSLRRLLRNPLGFVWTYALGMQEPRMRSNALLLEPFEFGDLFHGILDRVIRDIEETTNVARISSTELEIALHKAIETTRDTWEAEQAIPPRALWLRTLQEVHALAVSALEMESAHLDGQESYSEVPFGGSRAKHDADAPWNPDAEVSIAGTPFKIAGYIDRLDLSEDRTRAKVRDYKTGRAIDADAELDGGKELQRALYRTTVRALLGEHVEVETALLYPKDKQHLPLADDAAVADRLAAALVVAHRNLLAGNSILGIDAGDAYDDLQLALPANAANGYLRRKDAAAEALLGDTTAIWKAN